MPDYRLTEAADRDVFDIAHYTLENWDEAQVDRYLLGLDAAFGRLSRNPSLGKASETARAGYLRYRYRSHVIFYKRLRKGILIVRILHAQMDYLRHL